MLSEIIAWKQACVQWDQVDSSAGRDYVLEGVSPVGLSLTNAMCARSLTTRTPEPLSFAEEFFGAVDGKFPTSRHAASAIMLREGDYLTKLPPQILQREANRGFHIAKAASRISRPTTPL